MSIVGRSEAELSKKVAILLGMNPSDQDSWQHSTINDVLRAVDRAAGHELAKIIYQMNGKH